MPQDARFDLSEELSCIYRIVCRFHFPVRLEQLLNFDFNTRGLHRLFEQAHRHAMLLGLGSKLLRVLERRHAREIDNNVVRQFRRRFCRSLPVQLVHLSDEFIALFVIAHFASSFSTMVLKTGNPTLCSMHAWSHHLRNVRSASRGRLRLMHRPAARQISCRDGIKLSAEERGAGSRFLWYSMAASRHDGADQASCATCAQSTS